MSDDDKAGDDKPKTTTRGQPRRERTGRFPMDPARKAQFMGITVPPEVKAVAATYFGGSDTAMFRALWARYGKRFVQHLDAERAADEAAPPAASGD